MNHIEKTSQEWKYTKQKLKKDLVWLIKAITVISILVSIKFFTDYKN